MKVLSVVGNRPQFIKSAPLSLALREAGIDDVVLHTSQHYDREMSQIFFEELGLPEPRYYLGLETSDVGRMLPDIVRFTVQERPDWVLVYGDTNSTLAGAQAAVSTGVPVAHVEAGLRSGDVMADATMRFAPIARERSNALDRFGVEPGAYLLATVHREANVFQPRLGRIVEGLNRIDEPLVFPAHPRTRAALNGTPLAPHVILTEPLGYLDLAALASQARVVLTDSGGLQKEAYWYGVPCVTMRPSTEWVDTVETGANVLVDDDPERIAAAVAEARMPAARPPLYGDGRAAERIADLLYSLSRS